MDCYFSDEPIIRTMNNDSSGMAQYTVTRVTSMQGDTPMSGVTVYSNTAYCPDGHDDLEVGGLLRSLLSTQETNLSRLQYLNAQGPGITQSTFAFNTYLSVTDSSGGTSDTYSILYDTRGITTYEAGITNVHIPDVSGYTANLFPDKEITWQQYFSLMYRCPSNRLEPENIVLGVNYQYTTGMVHVDAFHVLEQKMQWISFRYSGPADFQEWFESHTAERFRFYIADTDDQIRTYITPWLYPKPCDEPDTVYLYWVNSLGGVDFVRGKMTKSKNHEDSTYESNTGIDERLEFGERIYHQRKWDSYSFSTSIVSDADSPSVADVCGARWAWICVPGESLLWKSVKVLDTQATVKTYRNQGAKLYNYTFELEDATKVKTI